MNESYLSISMAIYIRTSLRLATDLAVAMLGNTTKIARWYLIRKIIKYLHLQICIILNACRLFRLISAEAESEVVTGQMSLNSLTSLRNADVLYHIKINFPKPTKYSKCLTIITERLQFVRKNLDLRMVKLAETNKKDHKYFYVQ